MIIYDPIHPFWKKFIEQNSHFSLGGHDYTLFLFLDSSNNSFSNFFSGHHS